MSGSIIVFTDSDCLSSQRQIRPCYNLFEHLVDVVTRNRQDKEIKPSFMMEDPFKLPQDYNKRDEEVIYKSLQEYVSERTQMDQLIKNSQLNSLILFDTETKKSVCPSGVEPYAYYSALEPY